jgi:predicted DNA-binding transcriptional regulator AlpA
MLSFAINLLLRTHGRKRLEYCLLLPIGTHACWYGLRGLNNLKGNIVKQTLNTQDIATLLGVSRQHVTNRIVKRPDFPKPVINLTQRLRAWRTDEVLAYFKSSK